MNFAKLVEDEKIKARKANIEEVRKDIHLSWVKTKIENHIIAFGGIFTYKEIEDAILNNDIVASKFCKDPSKQNISEKLAAKVLGLEILPQSGLNSIRFSETGEIVHTAGHGNSKAADFLYNNYYATQKYTDNTGGAQDNQRDDVINFLTKGSIKNKVAAIVDGSYWDYYMPILKEQFKNNPNVLITSITEITGGKE